MRKYRPAPEVALMSMRPPEGPATIRLPLDYELRAQSTLDALRDSVQKEPPTLAGLLLGEAKACEVQPELGKHYIDLESDRTGLLTAFGLPGTPTPRAYLLYTKRDAHGHWVSAYHGADSGGWHPISGLRPCGGSEAHYAQLLPSVGQNLYNINTDRIGRVLTVDASHYEIEWQGAERARIRCYSVKNDWPNHVKMLVVTPKPPTVSISREAPAPSAPESLAAYEARRLLKSMTRNPKPLGKPQGKPLAFVDQLDLVDAYDTLPDNTYRALLRTQGILPSFRPLP